MPQRVYESELQPLKDLEKLGVDRLLKPSVRGKVRIVRNPISLSIDLRLRNPGRRARIGLFAAQQYRRFQQSRVGVGIRRATIAAFIVDIATARTAGKIQGEVDDYFAELSDYPVRIVAEFGRLAGRLLRGPRSLIPVRTGLLRESTQTVHSQANRIDVYNSSGYARAVNNIRQFKNGKLNPNYLAFQRTIERHYDRLIRMAERNASA